MPSGRSLKPTFLPFLRSKDTGKRGGGWGDPTQGQQGDSIQGTYYQTDRLGLSVKKLGTRPLGAQIGVRSPKGEREGPGRGPETGDLWDRESWVRRYWTFTSEDLSV